MFYLMTNIKIVYLDRLRQLPFFVIDIEIINPKREKKKKFGKFRKLEKKFIKLFKYLNCVA